MFDAATHQVLWDADGTGAGSAQLLATRFREKSRAEWEQQLDSPGCCAAPVLGLAEAPQHPHNVARGTFIEIDGVVQPAPAPRFSRTMPPTPTGPALPGDHTLEVLAQLGLDDDAITGVLDSGIARQSSH